MKKNSFAPLLLVIYFIVLAVEIFGDIKGPWTIVYFTKPLLMPILLVYYLMNLPQGKKDWIIPVSLIFSMFGDIFLMIKNGGDQFFIFGLVSFLIAHILYIVYFYKEVKGKKLSLKIIPFTIFVIAFLAYLVPQLMSKEETKMLISPVIIYATVIGAMAYFASLRPAYPSKSFYYVMNGSLLFILSDSCIAINAFVMPINYSGLIIMITYGLAQYYIIRGILEKYN